MPLDDDLLLELIQGLYDAALTPAAWPRALERLSDAFGGAGLHLGIQRPDELHSVTYVREDPSYVELWKESYATAEDNVLHEQAMNVPAGALALRHELIATPDYHRAAIYQEVIRPQGFEEFGQAMLVRAADFLIPFAIARQKSAGTFHETERRFLERLLPHLANCMQIQLRLELARVDTTGLAAVLDRLPVAVLLLDRVGRVLRSNEAAEALLRAGDGLALREGRIVAASRPDSERLARLIGAAAATGARRGAGSGGTMALPRPAAGRPLSVMVTPLPERAMSERGIGAAAVMLVREPGTAGAVSGRHLMELFGLTLAEARVATALLGADGPRGIAAELGVGLATIRTHLHRLYDKTGTRGQAELIRLLAGLAQP